MAHWSPSSKPFASPSPAASWSRWSSLVRLAVMGGDARCAECGSRHVRREWTPLPAWKRALRLDPCRCDACGATFQVPRRAATQERDYEPVDLGPDMTLPPPAEVDLAALDREMALRLGRRRPEPK
jgi:hypothetical protein